jgi:AcrR family transcriptional regulator
MPKRVDHEQRRRLIAAAIRHIVAERGLEAVSLGEVAAEAGISKGLVQHYFPTREAMLRYTTGTLRDHVENQVGTEFAGGLTGLRAALVALLPLSDESRTEALVANAFIVHALKDPEIADRFRVGHAQLREAVAAMVTAAQADGDLDAQLDAVQEADLLLAVVAGLGDAVLLGHRTPEEAISLVDHHLSRLRPPSDVSPPTGNMSVLPAGQSARVVGNMPIPMPSRPAWGDASASADLTTRARIGNAAMAQFAVHGYVGTSLRMVAEAAGVSVGLVQHHFGTKADLRAACDAHVTEFFQTQISRGIESREMSQGDFLAEAYQTGPPVLDYFARALVEGSPGAAALFDDLVVMTEQHVRTVPAPGGNGGAVVAARTVAAVLTAMKLGVSVLRDHLDRVLDVRDTEAGSHEISKALLVIVSPSVVGGEISELAAKGLQDYESASPRLR